jgi:hypothetical protein
LRICRKFIEENSNTWKDEKEMRNRKRIEEEKKEERLKKAAEKKGNYRKAYSKGK